MRAVHILDEWLPLTQAWLALSIRHLPASVTSTIVCSRLSPNPPPPPGQLVHVPPLTTSVVAGALDTLLPGLEPRRVARHVAMLAPDVLHAHFGASGWDARAAARRVRRPFVVSFYGIDVDALLRGSPKWRGRYRQIFDDAGQVLALGPWMADRLVGHGADAGRLVVHHLGVPVDELRFRPRAWAGDRPLRVLIASSFREKKGIPLAIEALAQVRRRVALAVTLVGDASAYPPERREKERILETIARHGMSDVVDHVGYLAHADLVRLAFDHDLLVAASRTASDGDSEGTPMTLVELAATGIIAVATRHADIPEIVTDEVTGFLADEGDLASFVDALERSIAAAERWPDVGAAARTHVGREFDAVTQGRRLAALYEGLAR